MSDPVAVERQYWLTRLGWAADDPSYSVAELQDAYMNKVPIKDINPLAAPLNLSNAVVIPPVSAALAQQAEVAWFAANYAVGVRFMLPYNFIPSVVQMPCTIASGNIEIGIYSVQRTAVNLFTLVKLTTTGIIPCPAIGSNGAPPNSISVPIPPVKLPPGEYVLAFWCDNTIAAFVHVLANSLIRGGLAIGFALAQAGGLLVNDVQSYGGRAVCMIMEGSIPLA